MNHIYIRNEALIFNLTFQNKFITNSTKLAENYKEFSTSEHRM